MFVLLIKMVYQFSFEELTDIHFCYGLADGNANLARRLYQDKYPNRHLPNNRTFTSVHTRLRERGTFKTNHGGNSGRERTTREVHVEEDIPLTGATSALKGNISPKREK